MRKRVEPRHRHTGIDSVRRNITAFIVPVLQFGTHLLVAGVALVMHSELVQVVGVERHGVHVAVRVVQRHVHKQARVRGLAVCGAGDGRRRVAHELCRVEAAFDAAARLTVARDAHVRLEEDDAAHDEREHRDELPRG